MSEFRIRTRETPTPSGTITYQGNTGPSDPYIFAERTDDWTRAWGKGFSSKKITPFGGRWNGDWTAGLIKLENAYCYPNSHLVADIGFGRPVRPSLAELATTLVAKTNPSRPVVDLPVFIAELKDIPEMIYIGGKKLIEKAASANLQYQFGYAPIVSDLVKLLDFNKHFSDREKEIKALQSGGLRRKRQLWADRSELPEVQTTNFWFAWNCTYRVKARYFERVWGSVKWVPTTLAPQTDDAIRGKARDAVLGLTLDFATAWELIPWSWLVDWCTNAGDYLMASRNIVGAVPTEILIMHHTIKSTICYAQNWVDVFSHEPNGFRTDLKERTPAAIGLSAGFPFLDARKLSILGSIGVLANRRR